MNNQSKVVRYEVRGRDDSGFPYLNDVESLKNAVGIAKTYVLGNVDGSATDVIRRVELIDGSAKKWGYSHRWRVFPDGQIELLIAYNFPFQRTKLGLSQFWECMARSGITGGLVKRPQAAEVHNVLQFCDHMGYGLAAQMIRDARDKSGLSQIGRASTHEAPMPDDPVQERMGSRPKRWLSVACLLWVLLVWGQVVSEWPDKTRPLGVMPELPSLQQYEDARREGLAKGTFFDYFASKVSTRQRIMGAKIAFEEAYPDRVRDVVYRGLLLTLAPALILYLLGRLVPVRRMMGYRALRPAMRT